MNSNKFKNLSKKLKAVRKSLNALQLFDSNNFIICLSKSTNYDYKEETVTEIDDDCNIKGFYYSGKFITKKILMIKSEDFNPLTMELITSKHLKRKTEIYVIKWIHKMRKKLLYNYDIVTKKSGQFVQSIYANNERTIEKDFVKKVRMKAKEYSNSEWKEIYEIKSHLSPNSKIKKAKKSTEKKSKNEIKEMIELSFQDFKNDEIGLINIPDDQPINIIELSRYCHNCKSEMVMTNESSTQIDMHLVKTSLPRFLVYNDSETQTEKMPEEFAEMIKELKEENQMTSTADKMEDKDCQTDFVVVKQKVKKDLSEIDPNYQLGEAYNKRTNELETVYDEICSSIRRGQRVKSPIEIDIPAVHYIGFDGFNILNEADQNLILDLYRKHAKILKRIVSLKNIGINRNNEREFIEVINSGEDTIREINILLGSIKEQFESESYGDIKIKMIEESNIKFEDTPPEGSQQVLEIEDSMMDDLMSSFNLENL